MNRTTYGLSPDELFRVQTAYGAIRDPKIRTEFLTLIEAWAQDQWTVQDTKNARAARQG